MLNNKSEKCFNCGSSLVKDENFCPNCGQKNSDLNISVPELGKEFAGDYFTFDSKLFRTLWPLITKPGKVAKEYIDGKRVKHIPPLRVFIFLSFITFFLWGSSFEPDFVLNDSENVPVKNDSISANQAFMDSINTSDNMKFTFKEDSIDTDSTNSDLSYFFNKENDPKEIVDSIIGDESELLKKVMFQGLRMYQAEKGSVKKYFMENVSIVLLLIQPFFALLLKLVYFRRKNYFYIEHLVFSLYYHAFILLLSILVYFLYISINIDTLTLWTTLLSIVYLTIAMKQFYNQSWKKTLLKSAIVSFIYFGFMLPIFVIGYILISLYFY
jgi:hypothetical protein